MDMGTPQAKTHQVVFKGEVLFTGCTDDCYKWMHDNKITARLVPLPVKPFDPPTMKELQEWFEAGFYIQIHIGWDAWGRPASLDEIRDIAESPHVR